MFFQPKMLFILSVYCVRYYQTLRRFIWPEFPGERRTAYEWYQQRRAKHNTWRITQMQLIQAYSEREVARREKIDHLEALYALPESGSPADVKRRRNAENFDYIFRDFRRLDDE